MNSEGKLKLDTLGAKQLSRKYSRFVEQLSPAQIVVFASYDANRMFGELALYELVNNDDFRRSFQRQEIEALQYYYIRGATEEDIKSLFVIDFPVLNKKYVDYCVGIFEEGTNSFDAGVKLGIIRLWEKTLTRLAIARNYVKRQLNTTLQKLRELGSTEQMPYPY